MNALTTVFSADVLDGQFFRFAREPFMDGLCARLWRADQGVSVSLLPVMALLSRDGRQGECHLRNLAKWAGITPTEFRRARLTFLRNSEISLERSRRRGYIRFTTSESLAGIHGTPTFAFPGCIISSGVWASLAPDVRTVLLALRATSADFFFENCDDSTEGVEDWLEEIDAVEYQQHCGAFARRVGQVDLQQLVAMTGIDSTRAFSAITALCRIPDDLCLFEVTESGMWYHLPGGWWGIPEGSARSFTS